MDAEYGEVETSGNIAGKSFYDFRLLDAVAGADNDTFRYGEITVPVGFVYTYNDGKGFHVRIPYTPDMRRLTVRLVMESGSGGTEYLRNPATGKHWFPVVAETEAGTADIASSSRGLNADEQDLGLTPIVIAHDGIAVIVNDDNPVDNLSTEQLRDIYAGKITNWKEVGGEDLRIQVINRDEASGTREAFRTIVMDGTPFDRRSAVLSGTGQVRDVVSRSRGAIGYISLGFVESLNAKTSVKAVSVNHVEASEKTVASGGYPISRDLYFFVKGAPSQQAQDYIDYVTSEKMDKQIREAGFIPVTNDEKGSE